ncbi:glycosyltransferase family 1 protein [Candidatus Peribacteria bacterium]|nr:glycosyltransferase family 1 protein [Candidatus Peribacteria bacterium]
MKKNIVYLSAFLSPFRSGAEAMVEEVSKRLSRDHAITIITARLSRTLPKQDTLDGDIRVIRVGVGLPIDKILFPFLAPFVVRLLKPDVVHAVLESYAGLALVFCKFMLPRAKRILTLQSTNTSLLLGPMHRSADVITGISTVLVERAKKYCAGTVILIPNGIDLLAIREACSFHAKDSGLVLFVGRLEPMKGVDTLLKAFSKAIKGLDPSIRLRVIGSGSLLGSLQQLASELEIDHRVTFTGRIAGTAIFDEYAKAEIFCALSRSEALGNVFLEAEAAGCAVVATNVGGIPEIVQNGVSGVLVPVDDVDAAASALRNLLGDPSLRAKISGNAKKSAQQYDWKGIADRYAALYRF